MRYNVTIANDAVEPVTLEDAKEHVKALPDDDAEEQSILEPMVAAAREYCENITGMAFVQQTITAYPDAIGDIQLPRAPIQAITSVKIHRADGMFDTLDAGRYWWEHDGQMYISGELGANLRPVNPIEIVYTAGGECPMLVRQAMLLLIGHWYANREAVSTGAIATVEIELTTRALLKQYKRWWW